jgi:hypothetical protein
MKTKTESTYSVKIYASGSIEEAKQVIRKECLRKGLCVTISQTLFIYTGGEEYGFEIGLINYPRFPQAEEEIWNRAVDLATKILEEKYQHSTLVMDKDKTLWITKREE